MPWHSLWYLLTFLFFVNVISKTTDKLSGRMKSWLFLRASFANGSNQSICWKGGSWQCVVKKMLSKRVMRVLPGLLGEWLHCELRSSKFPGLAWSRSFWGPQWLWASVNLSEKHFVVILSWWTYLPISVHLLNKCIFNRPEDLVIRPHTPDTRAKLEHANSNQFM